MQMPDGGARALWRGPRPGRGVWTAVLLGLTMVVGAAACRTTAEEVAFREPMVTLRDVRLRGVGLNGGSIDIVVNVTNLNHFPLAVRALTYQLAVDSVRFGQGSTDQAFTVPPRDSANATLPLTFSYAGIGQAGRDLMGTGTVTYHVLGSITVNTDVGEFTRPFDRTARLASLNIGTH